MNEAEASCIICLDLKLGLDIVVRTLGSICERRSIGHEVSLYASCSKSVFTHNSDRCATLGCASASPTNNTSRYCRLSRTNWVALVKNLSRLSIVLYLTDQSEFVALESSVEGSTSVDVGS